MRKLKLLVTSLTLCLVSCDPSYVRPPEATASLMHKAGFDREIHFVRESGFELDERKRQIPAIVNVFSRRTTPERARRLAALCYAKTLGSSWMPLDLAEIALAETGAYGLSPKAVSHKGALGVWQLMPERAASHGFRPEDMRDDEKCAKAAVLELDHKLEMARGNPVRAKKFYCGIGPDADAYEVKRRQFRREILEELKKLALDSVLGGPVMAMAQ